MTGPPAAAETPRPATGLARGRLFVVEGPDEVGKTTLSQAVVTRLRDQGGRFVWLSFPGQEPGTLGALVYNLHHRPAGVGVVAPSPAALQLLHVAAHADAIERAIEPLLIDGVSIVLDRFWWSTVVYGLVSGVDPTVLQALVSLEATLWRGTAPAAVFLIDAPSPYTAVSDRAVWDRIRTEYAFLAEQGKWPYPVVVVRNAAGLDAAVGTLLDHINAAADASDVEGRTGAGGPAVAAEDNC